jgi:hypothetical protein
MHAHYTGRAEGTRPTLSRLTPPSFDLLRPSVTPFHRPFPYPRRCERMLKMLSSTALVPSPHDPAAENEVFGFLLPFLTSLNLPLFPPHCPCRCERMLKILIRCRWGEDMRNGMSAVDPHE